MLNQIYGYKYTGKAQILSSTHLHTHTHTPLIAVVLSTIGPALGVEWCRERLPFAETADVDIPGALL